MVPAPPVLPAPCTEKGATGASGLEGKGLASTDRGGQHGQHVPRRLMCLRPGRRYYSFRAVAIPFAQFSISVQLRKSPLGAFIMRRRDRSHQASFVTFKAP